MNPNIKLLIMGCLLTMTIVAPIFLWTACSTAYKIPEMYLIYLLLACL